jgi:ABC-type transport system involved in cytochrome bd biosynthesis fused ATPase/permease subunit
MWTVANRKEKSMENGGNGATLFAAFVVMILVALYFLPLLIAASRYHHDAVPIGVTNLLLGLTVFGWIVALVWACTAIKPR